MVASNKTPASEVLEILNKAWLDTYDIKILACVGDEKARKIKRHINEQLIKDGYFLPSRNVVPADKVVEYLNININYLKKVAKG